MVTKNTFIIYNNVISELYRCRTYKELGQGFLPILKMLVPFRYASIMRNEETELPVHLVEPLCVPRKFEEAENNYMRYADADYTGWLNYCRESTLFRESDLVGEQKRLRSLIWRKCYQKFKIYDCLNFGIVHNSKPLGCLSLFRAQEDGPFTEEELFLMNSVGMHLNHHMARLLELIEYYDALPVFDFPAIAEKYALTARETQLVELLTQFFDNREIASQLNVRESTLQKHFQNIFHKLGVTSRWEMMRLLTDSKFRESTASL